MTLGTGIWVAIGSLASGTCIYLVMEVVPKRISDVNSSRDELAACVLSE